MTKQRRDSDEDEMNVVRRQRGREGRRIVVVRDHIVVDGMRGEDEMNNVQSPKQGKSRKASA